jgi:hypothetical protein
MADFNDSTERLVRAIALELRRFDTKFPEAVVTKLAVVTDWTAGTIIVAIDTSVAKKWKPAAFAYPRFAELHGKPELADLVRRGTQGQRDLLSLYTAAALSCVDGMGHLPFDTTDEFAALVFEGRATEADAHKLMRRASVKLTAHTDRSRFGSPVWDNQK